MSLHTPGDDHQTLFPDQVEERLKVLFNKLVGACLGVLAVIVWSSLLTWSADDQKALATGARKIGNIIGPVGAVVSEGLLESLGLAAVLALLPFCFWGVSLYIHQDVPRWRSKFVLWVVAVVALAGALAAVPTVPAWPFHHGFGGFLGDCSFAVVASVLTLFNPSHGGAAAGLLLFAGGSAALSASLGAGHRELALLWRDTSLDTAVDPHAYSPFPGAVEPSFLEGGHRIPRDLADAVGDDSGDRDADVRADSDDFDGHAQVPRPTRRPPGWVAAVKAELAEHWSFVRAQPDARDRQHGVREQQPAAATIGQPTPAFAASGRVTSGSIQGAARPHESPGATGTDRRGAPSSDWTGLLTETDDSGMMAHRFAASASQRATRQPAKTARGLLDGLRGRPAEPDYRRPSLNILKKPLAAKAAPEFAQNALRGIARLMEDVLLDFGIKGQIQTIRPGPVVTLFELEPVRGLKAARIIGLADDIARSMSATSARVAPVPGRNVIGIELPNTRRETVLLRELLETDAYKAHGGTLPLVLGRSIGGEPVVADLTRMPHLLVAGTTGSGKSVGINAMILSLLYRLGPQDCRFLMIDPKMLELSIYNGIPHLLAPVITDPQRAVAALGWVVREMEERYKRMTQISVRNIDVFNNRVRHAQKLGEPIARTVQTGFDQQSGQPIYVRENLEYEPMPYIVVIVDEMADLMLTAGKEIESAVQRLAQMARAAGIHLIMATQRPSVDVITGTIKANFPTRISFKVTSKIDSRTILGEQGAEQLLGAGDMLFSSGAGPTVRVHGPFVSDEEVEHVASYLRSLGEPGYIPGIGDVPGAGPGDGDTSSEGDDLYDKAVAVIIRDGKATTSYIQRRLAIGYNRAAGIMERMEQDGLVSAPNSVGKRQILIDGGQPGHRVA